MEKYLKILNDYKGDVLHVPSIVIGLIDGTLKRVGDFSADEHVKEIKDILLANDIFFGGSRHE
ncbi:hypothetical protein D3C74_186260 [compost metagenome]